jgi:hypothetical protein
MIFFKSLANGKRICYNVSEIWKEVDNGILYEATASTVFIDKIRTKND